MTSHIKFSQSHRHSSKTAPFHHRRQPRLRLGRGGGRLQMSRAVARVPKIRSLLRSWTGNRRNFARSGALPASYGSALSPSLITEDGEDFGASPDIHRDSVG